MRLILPTFVVVAVVASLLGQATAMVSGLDSWLADNPISTIAKTVIPKTGKPTSNNLLLSNPSAFTRCPKNCSEAGIDPSNWAVYHSAERLALCNQTMLLNFNLYNDIGDHSTHASIRSCTADGQVTVGLSVEPKENSAVFSAGVTVPMKQHDATLQLAWVDSDNEGSTMDVAAAVQQIGVFLGQQPTHTDGVSFASSGETVVGVFAGSQIQSQGLSTSVLENFVSEVKTKGISGSLIVQLCGESRSSKYAIGIVANAHSDLAFVQNAVKTWKDGKCVTSFSGSSEWPSITLATPVASTSTSKFTITPINDTYGTSKTVNVLRPRTTCTTTQVSSGDSCASLAAECGITASAFTDYNPGSTICSSLTAGQHVCCSSGTLPDFSPKPYSNGTCATYLVQSGDSCSSLAATYSLSVDELESYNNNTWGWMGCSDLQAANNICLSTGSPPMPASVANAICGPQVPGTPAAPSGTNLSMLNECPLNACCDIWGQCGITSEFCDITQSITGAPGTAAKGTNGCISNCGTNIIVSSAPAKVMKVGYFEAFNLNRPCLNGHILDIDYHQYTHVHLGFGAITADYDINVTAISSQFDMFLDLPNVKRILSIGGWSFSTDPSTYNIFREAVMLGHQEQFINNIVAFVKKYDLDGIDFDWEYPGEPDIKGILPGSPFDGVNYWEFLTLLKSALSDTMPDATISIAAPASYWYLQGFPIQAIAGAVDYIIFMTYDLHGQWDYGNVNADIDCPSGNCLRSDVNLTETVSALSMITKAGVPSNQIVVGVTSYGRSFQMSEAGCYGPMCTYVGPSSGAYPGICTNTAGYLGNAEIDYMNVTMSNTYSYVDDSFSNILVFDDTQWVSYMDDDNKAVRTALYESLNLAGTTDWAIDLQGKAQSLIDVCGSSNSSTGAPALCVSSDGTSTCTAGTGDTDRKDLCAFTCGLGFCPQPCTCTANGTANPIPLLSGSTAYVCPLSGLDTSYSSLCSFACKYGYCPTDYCVVSDSTSRCEGLVLDEYNATISLIKFTNQSTCTDLESYHQLTKAWMWNEMDTSTELKNWMSDNEPFDDSENEFVESFGQPLGIGETFGRYCRTIQEQCQAIDCGNMNYPGQAGYAWKYLVALSVANLNNALFAVLQAVDGSPGNYSALAPSLFSTYYPSYTASEFSLIEIITAIGMGVAALGAMTGNPLLGVAGTLFAGAATEFTNYLSTITGPDSSSTVTDFSVAAWDWSGNITNSLQNHWTSVIVEGSSELLETFADGAWVDYRTNPILNDEISINQLTDWYNYILVAGTVNYLWTQASIYIYCMPMSEDDFNSNTVDLPTGLTYYTSEGYGCYYQGISPETSNGDPIYYNPPGYENIVDAKYNFTTADMIQGSLTTWLKHGFNYTAPVDNSMKTVLEMSINEIMSGSLWTMDGTFNLPVCHRSGGDSSDLKSFFYYLNSPRNGGPGATASWCTCGTDINGKEFSTFVTYVNEVSCICDDAGCGINPAVGG